MLLWDLLPPPVNRAWRKRLAEHPVHRGSDGGKGSTGVPSKNIEKALNASSLNRDMTPLRTALNWAFELGCDTSDFEWRVALKPVKDADGKRNLYLDKTQCQQLDAAISPDVGTFLSGLSMLTVRPAALSQLTVTGFDACLNRLRIRVNKTKPRSITLHAPTSAFFVQQCRGKRPGARIFSKADGSSWSKDSLKHPIKAAAGAAGLTDGASAYTLRHSTITVLVRVGPDLLTVVSIEAPGC